MHASFSSAVLAALLLSGQGAFADCPQDVGLRLHEFTEDARAGGSTPAELGDIANETVAACGEDRAVLSQIFGMFTGLGLALTFPNPDRSLAQLLAFRSVNRILAAGGGDFDPVRAGDATLWTVEDERNAYWDLMFAMSGDHLVFGVHAEIYTPGRTEQIGCGLYPDEEASALAQQAEGNLDGGELLARVVYLGRTCDTPERDTSGYAARYFVEHAKARQDDPEGYAGITENDIRAGLAMFLDRHLDGAAESWLFSADEVVRWRAF